MEHFHIITRRGVWIFNWTLGDESALIEYVASMARASEILWCEAAVICKRIAGPFYSKGGEA